MTQRVGSSENGSIQTREESGMRSMSDSCMEAQPRKEEASKPKPSSKEPSSISWIGKVRWCQAPTRSVKRTETNFAPWSSEYFKTVVASIFSPEMSSVGGGGPRPPFGGRLRAAETRTGSASCVATPKKQLIIDPHARGQSKTATGG